MPDILDASGGAISPSGDTSGAVDAAAIQTAVDEMADEFDEYLRAQLEDPEFSAAYRAAERWWRRAHAGPLAVDGHAYQRRLRARRCRRR